MRIEEAQLTGGRGVSLHRVAWLPPGEVTDSVVIVHGYGEHSGRYSEVAAALAEDGLAVHALDHRGHGRSEGPLVNVENFQLYIDDLDSLVRLVKARHAGRTFMLGHSLGGLVAASYAADHQDRLDGLILSAPAVMSRPVPPFLNLTARVLARVAPGAPVLKLPLEAISRDPQVVSRYLSDPLVHPLPMRARQAVQSAGAQSRLAPRLASISIPVLVMQGTGDRIVDPGSGPFLHARVGSADRTLKLYEGLYHEILNEPERVAVLADLRAWLAARRRAEPAQTTPQP